MFDPSGDRRVDRAGLGLQYRNECIQVDFRVKRDYASSSVVEPSTDFDLTIALTGFGAGNSGKEYRRTCSFSPVCLHRLSRP